MPYSQSQLRCLSGMGIVPWVERSPVQPDAAIVQADAATTLRDAIVADELEQTDAWNQDALKQDASNQDASNQNDEFNQNDDALLPDSSVSAEPTDFMQIPLMEIPFRGERYTQLGKPDALLLILVEANSTQQSQYPFEPTDAKIFDDMLRAISWRRQDVCLGVIPPSSAPSLFVDNNAPSVSDLCKPHRDAVLLFRQCVPETRNIDELMVPLERAGMSAWQLPHPALLRESPEHKRQAWIVLKAARARLG